MNHKQKVHTCIHRWVYWLVAGIICSGCSGTVSPGTSTPIVSTHLPAPSSTAATPLAISMTATADLSPIEQAVHELYAGDFHFIYTSTEKRAEGDATMDAQHFWFQYSINTTNGTDEYGSINGDWIVVFRTSLLGFATYRYVSGKYVATRPLPINRDISFYDVVLEISTIDKVLKQTPANLQFVGIEQIDSQACLHYRDTNPDVKHSVGDIWVSQNGHHLIQTSSQQTSNITDPDYKVTQFQAVFSNFGVPFAHKGTNIPPSN